jgi:hypothetical protein
MEQSTISFKSKILDFSSLFGIINENDEITVYSELGKKTLMVKTKDIDKITLISLDDINDITVWDREPFCNNVYNIYDIVITGDFVFDVSSQRFNLSVNELTENLLGFETYYIEKYDWEKIYPISEQRDDIFHSLVKDVSAPSINLIAKMNKKANSFVNLIEIYQKRDYSTSEFVQDVRKTSDEIPELDFLKSHHFRSNIIFPIIEDAKYIYDDNALFMDDDDTRKIYYDEETYGEKYDILQLSQLEEINLLYATYKSANLTPTRLSFNDAKRIEYFGGELPDIVTRYKKGKLPTDVLPIYTAYKSVIPANNFYKFQADKSFFAYRNITPNNPFLLSDKFTTNIVFQNRYVRGSLNHLVDNPDITNINKNPNCVICAGTPKTGEHIYYSDKDPYVKPGKDFNLSISKEPTEVPYLNGEDVSLVGFLVKSPYHINPDFNTLYKREFNLEKYILEHYGGYLNIIERYIYNRSRSLNPMFVNEIEYIGNKLEDINYTYDNFIKFNSSLDNEYSLDNYNKILQDIVLDQNKVLQIETENIQKINNFTDLNKILSNYLLNIRNLNNHNFEKIKNILEKRYDQFKRSTIVEEEYKKYYEKLNKVLEISLSNLYQTLFTVDSYNKVDIVLISKLLNEMFKKEDKTVIQHLLKYYFFTDTDFISLDDSIILLTKCIYNRYYDYLCNESAFRIIFHPTHTIKNPEISSIIEDIKSFYDIGQISIHSPSKIGVLNELIHMLYIKDRSIHFNILVQYLHALNGLNKLELENNEWDEKYKNIESVNLLIKGDEENIKKVMSEKHMNCMKLRLSKIYLSLNSLNDDDNKENLELDAFLDISTILKSIYDKLISKRGNTNSQQFEQDLRANIIAQYPFENSQWIDDIIHNLILKNGSLDKTLVKPNDWALLIDTDLDFYRLYRRIDNHWIYNNSIPESERIGPQLRNGKLVNTPKNNLKFASLCNLEGITSQEIKVVGGLLSVILDDDISDLNRDIAQKCVVRDGICVAKVIADIDKNLQYNKHALKSRKYIDEQRNNLNELLQSLKPKIHNLQNKIKNIKDERFNQVFQAPSNIITNTKPVSQYDKILKHYKEQFTLVKNIPDDDVRLTELEKFIMQHGLFDRDFKDGKLVKVPVDQSYFIYWDISNITDKMCCKHWLVLAKQAYKSNNERSKLQKQLELNWGEELPNSKYIYCKKCDIAIGLSRESDNDGFDADDRLIQFREAVIETSIEDILEKIDAENREDLTNISFDSDGKNLKVLNDLITNPNIEIPYSDKKELLENVSEFLKRDNILDIYHFESELITKDNTNIEGLKFLFVKNADGKLPIEKYVELRNQQFPKRHGYVLSARDISSIPNQKLGERPNLFVATFTKIKSIYEKQYNFKRIMYLCGRLVISLIIADPEYKITGSAERSAGQAIYSNFIARPDLAIKTVSDKLYTLLTNSRDEVYTTSNTYLTQISTKGGKSPKENLSNEIDKIVTNYRSIQSIFTKIKEKIERVTRNKQILIDKIKNSLEWKTFRPYLKISDKLDDKIIKLDEQIKIIEKELTQGKKNKEKYYSYLLSTQLFYNIQWIIQTSEPMIKNSFTNFCCLTEPRVNYFDHFMVLDHNISLILGRMNAIQKDVFYNPHQNLYLLYGNKMNVETPNLLNYINENSPLVDINEVTKRIRTLITNYTLLHSESSIVGKRRLYSNYYDKYINDIKKIDRDALLQKMIDENTHINPVSISLRHKNLYSSKAGLIRHDTISNKYIWDIENEINEILLHKSYAEYLDIYYNLLTKLYLSCNLQLSKKPIVRIPLYHNNSSIVQQFLEQYTLIGKSLSNIQKNIMDNYISDFELVEQGMPVFDVYNEQYYSTFNLCLEKFNKLPSKIKTWYDTEIDKSHSNIQKLLSSKEVSTYEEGLAHEQDRIKNDLIQKNDNENKEIWKELLLEIPKIIENLDKLLKPVREPKCWINNISLLQGNGHKEILKEIKERIPNQILIEGYGNARDIANQTEIRNKYIDNKFKSRNLDTMKRYYSIIHAQISRFKYFKMDCAFNIANRKRINNKNLATNSEYDFELNSYNVKNFFSNEIYDTIDKNNILTPIDCDAVNSLISIDTYNMTNKGIRSNVDYISQVISYLLQVELLKFMTKSANREFYAEFCYQFIWKNNIENLEILNMMSEKDVRIHLRNILASENKNRLSKFKDLSESKKILHKLKRDLGLGNMSVPDDDSTSNAVQDETEIINEMEEQYNAGDLIAHDRELHETENAANVRVDLLIGADADESSRQMAREFLEQQDAEDNAAALEFGMAGVRNENEDDDNEEYLDE